MNDQLLQQVSQLSVEEQLELVETVWDRLVAERGAPLPTADQKAELDRGLADLDAHPQDVLPWSEVQAATRARLAR